MRGATRIGKTHERTLADACAHPTRPTGPIGPVGRIGLGYSTSSIGTGFRFQVSTSAPSVLR
jgi:hypothetical protein